MFLYPAWFSSEPIMLESEWIEKNIPNTPQSYQETWNFEWGPSMIFSEEFNFGVKSLKLKNFYSIFIALSKLIWNDSFRG